MSHKIPKGLIVWALNDLIKKLALDRSDSDSKRLVEMFFCLFIGQIWKKMVWIGQINEGVWMKTFPCDTIALQTKQNACHCFSSLSSHIEQYSLYLPFSGVNSQLSNGPPVVPLHLRLHCLCPCRLPLRW